MPCSLLLHSRFTRTSQPGIACSPPDSELSQITINGLLDYGSLSETEKARFVATFMAFLLCSQDAFIKWREGSLSPELWSGWELMMMNLVIPPGGQAFWKERGYLFGDAFRDYVENVIMKREPHPNAKPMGAFSLSAKPSSEGAPLNKALNADVE